LPDFADDAKKSNDHFLEAIQMAWYDEWQSEYGG
jgi:FeS assembly protein IscX